MKELLEKEKQLHNLVIEIEKQGLDNEKRLMEKDG